MTVLSTATIAYIVATVLGIAGDIFILASYGSSNYLSVVLIMSVGASILLTLGMAQGKIFRRVVSTMFCTAQEDVEDAIDAQEMNDCNHAVCVGSLILGASLRMAALLVFVVTIWSNFGGVLGVYVTARMGFFWLVYSSAVCVAVCGAIRREDVAEYFRSLWNCWK